MHQLLVPERHMWQRLSRARDWISISFMSFCGVTKHHGVVNGLADVAGRLRLSRRVRRRPRKLQ
ncbi:MAG: hypothetical protein QM756_28640 [Polyangiaceae bacterium]